LNDHQSCNHRESSQGGIPPGPRSRLTVLNQRVASPRELAAEQNTAVTDVAYHVRVLRELGMIQLVSTRQVRGATEHFYRSVAQPDLDDEIWGKLLASYG